MDDISKKLGISKKTLYQCVDNKADLIHKIMFQRIESELVFMEEIRSSAKDAIDEMLGISKHVTQTLREISPTTIYDLHKYYREIWNMVEVFQHKHIYNFIKTNLEQGIEQGYYRTDFNPDIITKFYLAKNLLVVDQDMFPLRDYNKEKLFQAFIEYHIRAVASGKGLKKLDYYLAKEKAVANR